VQTVSTGFESRRSRIVLTGPNRRRVTIGPLVNYYGIAWSPDSSKIAFAEGAVVTIADRDGRTRQVMHTGPGGPYPGACFDLVWSEGGRTLSFTQVENAEQLDLSRPTRVIITLGAAGR
jgi:Tol biopolymer transport system component